jgi:hypothetical protein
VSVVLVLVLVLVLELTRVQHRRYCFHRHNCFTSLFNLII